MFKSIKRKIVSFLMIVGALTQTAKAEEPIHQEISEQKTITNAPTQKSPLQNLPIDWKVGGSIGLLAVGALTLASISRSGKHLAGDDRYFQETLGDIIPASAQKTSPSQSVQAPVQVSQPQPAQQPDFDAMAIRPISPEKNMTPAERDLLAKRLRAIRLIEDINRERAKLTRQMAKAKRNHDEYAQSMIIAQRSALSNLRKDAFAQAVGPLYGKIKEERRMLTKKMALARRRNDESLRKEVIQRRAMLKESEKLATLTVRGFKYKQERAKFIKKKPVAPVAPIFTMKDYDRAMAA